MKTQSAVLVQLKSPLVLADLEIPALRPGQVLVEIAFSGVCQTQILERRGDRGDDRFLPHCLGHEAGGTILETGPGVTRVRAGDRVILSWMKGSGAEVSGTQYHWGDTIVNAGAITTFSRLAVASENRLTVVSTDIPLREAALLGCAVPTGLGAVLNVAQARPGQSMTIFGVGGVGLCAVAGAALAGCVPIVAVDVRKEKLDLARRMGATHTIDATASDPVRELRAMQEEGFDYAVEASGRPEVMRQALASVRSRGGTAVIIGNARYGERVELDPKEFNQGKRLLGTWGGDNVPDRDFPRYCVLLRAKRLVLEPLLTRTYPLRAVNEAMDDMETGKVARPLIDMNAE